MAGNVLATGQVLLDPLVELWNGFVSVLPGVIAAIIILIIGYFVSLALGYAVKRILIKSKIDTWMKKSQLDDSIGHINLSSLAGIITKWYIFILFLIPASGALRSVALGDLLSKLAMWLPNLIIALVIMLFGLIMADYCGDKVARAKMKGIKLMSTVVRWAIIIFIAVIAARQVGINVSVAENIILIIIGALAVAIALALGIGFGFGFKDDAKEIIKSIKKKI